MGSEWFGTKLPPPTPQLEAKAQMELGGIASFHHQSFILSSQNIQNYVSQPISVLKPGTK